MRDRDTAGAAWLAAASAVLIGIGAAADNASAATVLLLLALVVVSLPSLRATNDMLGTITTRSVVILVVVGAGLLAIAIPARAPVLNVGYVSALIVLTVIGVHALLTRGRWAVAQLGLVAVGHFALMSWMIGAAVEPDIDVWVFQQQASEALLNGANPFAMTFDLDVQTGSPFYTDEVIDGNRLNFGFIYPPVSLLMAVPGYLIAGDYRYGAAAALAAAGVVIALIRPGKLAVAGAVLLLFNPLTQQVLYWGWTDPFVILLLAITVFTAVRREPGATAWLGLLLASKQYMAPMLVVAATLLRGLRERTGLRRLLVIPVAVGAATVIPFMLWDFGAFVYSTVTVHLLQPFRPDSLSVPALLVRVGLPQLPSALSFVVAALALALVVWRAPRTPAGWCMGMAVVLLAFFLFSKQAFMHYYFLVIALLACALAATDLDAEPELARS